MGPNGAYAECLRVCVEQLTFVHAGVHKPALHDTPRVKAEIRELISIAKLISAVLVLHKDRCVLVLDLLGQLEGLSHRAISGRTKSQQTSFLQSSASYFKKIREILELRDRQ